MIRISDIVNAIERFAPAPLQEDYDNSGLIIGSGDTACTGVLIAFDVTEEVVAEAMEAGCNLIVSHHPLIFKGMMRLNGSTPVERTVMAAVRSGVAVYAGHTSVDNAFGGVSWRMAQMLGLTDVSVLDPLEGRFEKLTVYVPDDHADAVAAALTDAGAGRIGDYDSCSYRTRGEGTFRALDGARPFVGSHGELHREAETRIEVLLPGWRHSAVERALRAVHPYEEPAYEFFTISSGADRRAGAGVVGTLPQPMTPREFADLVKSTFGTKALRCTDYPADALISRVALCGGSGAFLTAKALRAGAQAYVTADVKYHDFADWAGSIFLVDAGHFETEYCVTSIFYDIITEIFPNFAVRCAITARNPVNYM